MYPARMSLHQEGVRRACERFPLFRKGTVLENRFELMQDCAARSAPMVKDRLTGEIVAVTIFADVIIWDLVEAAMARIETGETVINLPSYAVRGSHRRRSRR